MAYLTTKDVAEMLCCAVITVQKACQRLGYVKGGRDYIIDADMFLAIKGKLHSKPGRPRTVK